jgi:hypothetical protein
MKVWIGLGAGALACLIGSQFVSIFVVQPIGAVPEGRTLIISRLSTLKFIDSADGWCERQFDKVNLMCRLSVMGKVVNEATIIARLPYSDTLYRISTSGKTYER